MAHWILVAISGLIIFLGVVGSVLPFLPGPPLSWIGLLIYAIFTKFQTASVTAVVVLGALTLINIIFDIVAPGLAAKGYKASKQSAWGAIIGGTLGIFVLMPLIGPVAIFAGPFIGAYIGEYIAVANKEKAYKAAKAALVGIVAGAVFKLALSIAILAYFFVAVLRF